MLNEAQQLYQQAEQQIQTTIGNLDGAIQFIIAAGNNHPNRIDICKQNTLPGGTTGEFLKGKKTESGFSQANPFQSSSGTNSSNAFSSNMQTSSPFGGSAAPNTSRPFGQSAQTAGTSAFGQPSGTSAFGQTNALATKPSPFGQASSTASNTPSSNPFGGVNNAVPAARSAVASGGGPYPPGSSKQHPDISSYASKTMNGQLTQWNGKAVTYQDGRPGIRAFNGSWTRIWFPDGAPAYYKDTELPAEAYDEKTKTQWQAFEHTGRFEGGVMPELPPMREACLWNI
ncbi:hypothetical protein ACHAQH_003714 [Verticillium albo-atrum]